MGRKWTRLGKTPENYPRNKRILKDMSPPWRDSSHPWPDKHYEEKKKQAKKENSLAHYWNRGCACHHSYWHLRRHFPKKGITPGCRMEIPWIFPIHQYILPFPV